MFERLIVVAVVWGISLFVFRRASFKFYSTPKIEKDPGQIFFDWVDDISIFWGVFFSPIFAILAVYFTIKAIRRKPGQGELPNQSSTPEGKTGKARRAKLGRRIRVAS